MSISTTATYHFALRQSQCASPLFALHHHRSGLEKRKESIGRQFASSLIDVLIRAQKNEAALACLHYLFTGTRFIDARWAVVVRTSRRHQHSLLPLDSFFCLLGQCHQQSGRHHLSAGTFPFLLFPFLFLCFISTLVVFVVLVACSTSVVTVQCRVMYMMYCVFTSSCTLANKQTIITRSPSHLVALDTKQSSATAGRHLYGMR